MALQEADRLAFILLPCLGVDHGDALSETTNLGACVCRLAARRAKVLDADIDGASRGGRADLVRQLQEAGNFEEGRYAAAMQGGEHYIADELVAHRHCRQDAAFVSVRCDR